MRKGGVAVTKELPLPKPLSVRRRLSNWFREYSDGEGRKPYSILESLGCIVMLLAAFAMGCNI